MIDLMEIHIPRVLKENIHTKFLKCYLFMDKRHLPSHYKSKKVIKYFEENKYTLIPVYLQTASSEFMVMEDIWNISKQDLFVLQYYINHL
jgi:hypothetical protein